MSVAGREHASHNHSDSAAYADGEVLSTAVEASTLLRDLHDDLHAAERELETQAERHVDGGAKDVDSWLNKVDSLQAELEQSKATARAVIQQAEAHKVLNTGVADWTNKAALLEKELEFNEALEAALGDIRAFNQKLGDIRTSVQQRKIVSAHSALKQLAQDLANAKVLPGNVIRALDSRSDSISQELGEAARNHLLESCKVTTSPARIDAQPKGSRRGDATLEDSITILTSLDALRSPLDGIASDLRSAFFSVRSMPKLQQSELRIWSNGEVETTELGILNQVSLLARFFSKVLPEDASQLLSEELMPQFLQDFEAHRLIPYIPLGQNNLTKLEGLLSTLQTLSEVLKSSSWYGASEVDGWMSKLPTLWVTRQREHILATMRQSLLSRLNERKEVERVETQTVDANEQPGTQGNEEEGAWDGEWNDESKDNMPVPAEEDGEDDASAWDAGDEDANETAGSSPRKPDAGAEEEAWGWGDDGADATPGQNGTSSVRITQPQEPQTRTLREQFTVTGVPGTVLDQCLDTFKSAQEMANSSAAQSPIGSGIPALWNLPALSLALYRAMAVASYGQIYLGKMLLYNDSSWMADQIRMLVQEDEQDIKFTSTVRRKLEQEGAAFDRFAKLAYGAEMESRRTILKDLLDGAQGFSNSTTSPYAEECDNAVAMATDHLRQAHQEWQPILARSALLQSVGSLLSTVISKFISDIEDLSDIGEDESARLLSYCKSISSVSDLFLETSPDGLETSDMTPLYCQKWLKLQYLAEILDGNLADIKYLWTEGELSIEFDAEEITELVRALFADSEHRRKAIAEIARSRRYSRE